MEEIGFDITFGSAKAQKGAKALESSMDKIEGKGAKTAKSLDGVESGLTKSKGAASGLTGGLGKLAGIGLAVGAIGGLMSAMTSQMPFLGQAFASAGKTVRDNLIRPLVQELLPIIMSILKWVQKNRINFALLGTTIATVFRTAFTIVAGIFNIIKKIAQNAFGDIMGSGQDMLQGFLAFINLMTLKILFAFEFLAAMFEPMIGVIGQSIRFLWDNILSPFIDGFLEGLMEAIIPALEEVGILFTELGKLFGDANSKEIPMMQNLFRGLGKIIGFVAGVLMSPFTILGWMIKATKFLHATFVELGNAIVGQISAVMDIISGLISAITTRIATMINFVVSGAKSIGSTLKNAILGAFNEAWAGIKDMKIVKFVSKLFDDDAKPKAPTAQPTGANNSSNNTFNDNRNVSLTTESRGQKNDTNAVNNMASQNPSFRQQIADNRLADGKNI